MTAALDKQWELDGPLFEAAEQGLVYQAQQLLSAGADVNARDAGRMTPLHAAAVHGQLGVFRLLVDNGADISAKTVRGKTPLELAELNDQLEIVGFYQDTSGAAPRVAVLKPLKLRRR